jgi:NADH-quinone oxidoreductase subunit E
MVQINYDFYEDLTAESFDKLFDQFAAGAEPKPGPQIDRQFSAPVGGATTLTTINSNGGTQHQGGASLADKDAKKPGAAANVREAPEPKPPLGDRTK